MARHPATCHVLRQFCATLLACLGAGQGVAWAQDGGAVVAQVQSLDREQAEQERLRRLMEGRPAAYEDRVMDASDLPALGETEDAGLAEGPLRSFFTETRLTGGRNDSGLALRMSTELGQRIGYRQQTASHGEFVLEADLRASNGQSAFGPGNLGLPPSSSGERITVRNLGFPLTPTVFVDSALGDIGSEVTDALSRTYRLSLGNSVVRGASARLTTAGLDLRAGAGDRGLLTGGPYPGFQRSRGTLAWVGATQRVGERSVAGVQINQGSDLPEIGANGALGPGSVQVTSAAAAWGTTLTLGPGRDLRGRVIGIHSQTQGGSGTVGSAGAARTASALVGEATLRLPGQRHEFGAYTAQPGLRFGDANLLLADRGAYWRMDAIQPRLSWGAGLEADSQDARPGLTGISRLTASANASWRLGRHDTLGGSGTWSRSTFEGLPDVFGSALSGATRNLSASAFWQTRFADWGRSTFRYTVRRNVLIAANIQPASGEELLWEQDWLTSRRETQRTEFGTTLGFARDRSTSAESVQPTAGVQFRLWPDADWSINGTLRYTARDSAVAVTRGWSGSVDTDYLLGGGWRLGGQLVLNQVTLTLPQTAFAAPLATRTNDAFASVYLRWEATRGSPPATLGAPTGLAGTGAVEGVVFFDANRDGERQVAEAGVPDVEVLLDGRYRVRTDREGRFAFPLVATGRHQLSLVPESVPLPWGQRTEEPETVEVPLRGVANARIPVVRVGE